MDLCLLTVKCIKHKKLIKLTIYLIFFEILKTVSHEWIMLTSVIKSLDISCIMLLITIYIYFLFFSNYIYLLFLFIT